MSPLRIPLQGIRSFPYFCPSEQELFLDKTGLTAQDDIERYITRGRFWQQQPANEAFTITSQQVLIFRRIGIIDCPDIDFYIAAASGQNPPTTPSLMPALSPNKKRAREDDDSVGGRASVPRSDTSHLSPRVFSLSPSPAGTPSHWLQMLRVPSPATSPSASPPASSLSPSSDGSTARSPPTALSPSLGSASEASSTGGFDSHSTFTGLGLMDVSLLSLPDTRSRPMATITSSIPTNLLSPHTLTDAAALPPPAEVLPSTPNPLLTPSDGHRSLPVWQPAPARLPEVSLLTGDSLDLLWDAGYVHLVPEEGIAIPWVERVYARDMAKAFALIGTTKDGLAARFQSVFPGLTFISSSWHRQQHAWRRSTEEERQWVASQPRTPAGLWKTCRRRLSGWKG